MDMLNELNQEYIGIGKAVDSKDPIPPTHMPRGHGSVAIMWKKQLDSYITQLPDGNDCIQCIEFSGAEPLLIISVYLPCKGSSDSNEEFQECIDLLHEIYSKFKDTHNILLGGDLNENASQFSNSKRSKHLQEFMKEHNLLTKDLGPTFIHPNGCDSTCIDFFLYSENFSRSIVKIIKLENIPGNISDHYPIVARIKYEYCIHNKPNKRICSKINWDKVDIEKYNATIENGILELNKNLQSIQDIEHAYIDLNQLLSKAASTSGPSKQIRKKKPKLQVMTPEIRQAITDKKNAYYDWKQNNRPNDPNNQWLQKKQECVHKGGILEGFREHFANLAKQSDNSQFDQAYIEQVDNEYATIIDICKHDFRHIPVEKQEIMNAIKSLNRNKSPDTYGVTAENLIHGGEILASYLQTLLNSSFEFCFIPDVIKFGILTPVFKNKGNKNDAKNYRGITITPTLSKIIETVLKFRINPKIICIQNPLQRGFTKNASPLYCSLIMEEFQRENKDLKKETIFVMLDAKSAFDVVKHSSLIRKLFHMGLTPQEILMIDDLYKNARSSVKLNGEQSKCI
ncbi:Hypothetical predicted protein [Mytilus galloprovincialis]|uniref:Reverse transcriptase domain-containing protein n=2 Tax=Mytilus galloprovincialis TaxID=29158 RepID=A0A8B6E8F6_MYTGA|nr:Hypothetical predicted protein [Mytilus galloprovincialis]